LLSYLLFMKHPGFATQFPRPHLGISPTHCPMLSPELKGIRDKYTTLASTGCTTDFCQAGRAIHTDETRVGENRALCVVEREAENFLQELHHEGFFASDVENGMLWSVAPEVRAGVAESLLVTLKIANEPFDEMSCVQVCPANAPFKVRQVLWALCVDGSKRLDLNGSDQTHSKFLTDFVDLELPFVQFKMAGVPPTCNLRSSHKEADDQAFGIQRPDLASFYSSAQA